MGFNPFRQRIVANLASPTGLGPGMVANQGETPEQTRARYTKDYWSPDRETVLGTGAAPSQQPSAPLAPSPSPLPTTTRDNYAGGAPPSPQLAETGWDANRVRQYFASRGVTPAATSPDYWAGKWQEWGKNDPAYFEKRLAAADEIIGGAQNSPWATQPTQGMPGQPQQRFDPGGRTMGQRFDNGGRVMPVGGGPPIDTDPGGGQRFDNGGRKMGRPEEPGGSFQDQIRARLMEQLRGLSQPVTAEDPVIAGQLQSQERGLERNRQDRRAAMAERMAASGLNSGGAGSGALESEIASGFEDKGEALSGLRSQLVGRELQSRRSQMAGLLQTALQSGDNDSARALQLQIAQMDDQIRRMQLTESGRQWDDRFGWDVSQGLYGRDRDLAMFGGGG